jgi:peptidoglycan-associated lipoprotein
MRFKTLSALLLAVVFAAGATGCKKKMDKVTPLPGYGGSAKVGDASPGNSLAPGGTNPGFDPNANPNANIVRGTEGQIPLGTRTIEGRPQDREKYRAQTVHFDFDRANVSAGEAAKVQEVASKFKTENPESDLLVEGHCDERGTEEYNRSLGERRALAIRELLVAAGVPADHVHTASFGKDKPADPGHNEAAWKQNRRGEFILVLPK